MEVYYLRFLYIKFTYPSNKGLDYPSVPVVVTLSPYSVHKP